MRETTGGSSSWLDLLKSLIITNFHIVCVFVFFFHIISLSSAVHPKYILRIKTRLKFVLSQARC